MVTKNKELRRKQNQRYYQKNKEKYSEYRRQKRREIKEFVNKAKSGGCEKCEENHPACLEFHHRDPSKKEFALHEAHTRMWSLKRLQKEMDKCDVLCANCHRKEHWG